MDVLAPAKLIEVKSELTKSRNPEEYEIRLENQIGEIIQILGDGYCLIEFSQFKIKMPVKKKSVKTWQFTSLMWYVHEDDFFSK